MILKNHQDYKPTSLDHYRIFKYSVYHASTTLHNINQALTKYTDVSNTVFNFTFNEHYFEKAKHCFFPSTNIFQHTVTIGTIQSISL